MAKPINLYQGSAPAAMAQMGQGISEAGARIGQIMQGGYESMGSGLSKGINTAVGEYAKYKDMNSQVKASEKSYQTLKSYLPEEVQKQFDSQIESMNQDPNLSLRDKAAFWDQAKSFIGTSVGQTFQMQKQKAELDAAMAREREATQRTLIQEQGRAEQLKSYGAVPQTVDGSTSDIGSGAPFYDQGMGVQQNPYASRLKKKHF